MVELNCALPLMGILLGLLIDGVHLRSAAMYKNNESNDNQQSQCGYSSCPKTHTNKINIHLVPHTHDDVGWLKTVDEYYYGTNKNFSYAGVQFVLDSVIPQLVMDKNKRFIYVEMSFFSKWWQEQDDKMKRIVKELVDNGQLEFINGGWCMNDEATTTYQSVIDQMTIGLKFLEENFGQCGRPKVGWQIDPFGHSNEQASLFAQFGFDGMFFQRIDYLDKWTKTMSKSLDLIWHGDEALASNTGSIYTNVFIDGYDSPSTFCFDAYCLDPNLVDNRKSYEYNIEERVSSFAGYVQYYSMHKRTNHIMIPMGGDFQYTSAQMNFKNLDKLIKYLNKVRPNMNAFYSTPSCYQYSLNEAGKLNNVSWPQKLDDFFPYGSDPHAYWTGYFTSRPSIKLFERKSSTILQVSRQMALAKMIHDLVDIKQSIENRDAFLQTTSNERWNSELQLLNDLCLEQMWQVMGDLQHHDAITGTEKQHVANDYVRRGVDAINQCINTLSLTNGRLSYDVKQFIGGRRQLDGSNSLWCASLNISHCWATEYYLRPSSDNSEGVRVTIFNPLAEKLMQIPIRLPCPSPCDVARLSIREMSSGNNITPLVKVPLNAGLNELKFRVSLADNEIQFYASLPAVGYNSYEIFIHNKSDSNFNNTGNQFTQQSTTTRDPYEHLYNTDRWIRTSPEYNHLDLGLSLDDYRRKQKDNFIIKIPIGAHVDENDRKEQQFLNFNLRSGQLEGINSSEKHSDDFLQFKQKFGFYYPYARYRSSGAYIMRPNSTQAYMLEQPERFKIFKSNYLVEIHQQWNDWIWQTIRTDAYLNYIEFDYVVGPLPIDEEKKIGIEVISRYETELATNSVFYTDSNGRQLIPRRRIDANETTEPVAANYYPVTTTMLLRDLNVTRTVDFAILTDRAQGGTSLTDGHLELLIHRRLLQDDNFGVSEPLNEPGEDGRGLTIRGQHRLLIKFQPKSSDENNYRIRIKKRSNHPIDGLYQQQLRHGTFVGDDFIHESETSLLLDATLDQIRQQSIRFLLGPILTFEPIKKSTNTSSFDHRISSVHTSIQYNYSLLNASLPHNVHLLTVQPWKDEQILLRFENLRNPLTMHKSMYPGNIYEQMLALYNEDQTTKATIKVKETSDDLQAKESPKCKRLHSHFQRSRYDGRYYTHRLPCASYLTSQQNQTVSNQNSETDECLDSQKFTDLTVDTKFDIQYLLNTVRIVDLQEMSLGANEKLNQMSRLNWNSNSTCNAFTPMPDNTNNQTTVILGPRQIRTYIARIVKI